MTAPADAPITEQEVERLARVLIRAADAADANYLDSAQVPKLFRENATLLRRLWAERDALLKVVGDACDWVGVLDTTNDVANHALRKQWIVRARAALKEPTK